MSVSRQVTITYDAPDLRTSDLLEKVLADVLFSTSASIARVTNQSMSAEPVIPSPEPLVEPPNDRGTLCDDGSWYMPMIVGNHWHQWDAPPGEQSSLLHTHEGGTRLHGRTQHLHLSVEPG